MSEMSWFIVVADFETGHTDVQDFRDDVDTALAAYSRLEGDARQENRRYEVVMISADDEESLRSLYPHYFTGFTRAQARVVARDWIHKPGFAFA